MDVLIFHFTQKFVFFLILAFSHSISETWYRKDVFIKCTAGRALTWWSGSVHESRCSNESCTRIYICVCIWVWVFVCERCFFVPFSIRSCKYHQLLACIISISYSSFLLSGTALDVARSFHIVHNEFYVEKWWHEKGHLWNSTQSILYGKNRIWKQWCNRKQLTTLTLPICNERPLLFLLSLLYQARDASALQSK